MRVSRNAPIGTVLINNKFIIQLPMVETLAYLEPFFILETFYSSTPSE